MSQPSPLEPARQRALILAEQGDRAAAIAMLEHAVGLGKVNLGEDDPGVLGAAHQLARLHQEDDDPSAARRVLEEAYAAGQWKLGESDPLMLEISYDLGVVAEELGNRHEARKALGRVVEAGRPVLGDLHWAVLKARAYLDGDTSVLRPDAPTPPPPPIQHGPEGGWPPAETTPPTQPAPQNNWPAQPTAPPMRPGPERGQPPLQQAAQASPQDTWPTPQQAAPTGPQNIWPPQQTAPPMQPGPENGWPAEGRTRPQGGWPPPEDQQTTYLQTSAPPVQQQTPIQQAPPNQRQAPPYQPTQQTHQPRPYNQVAPQDDLSMPAEPRIPMQPTYHDTPVRHVPATVEPALEKHGSSYQRRGPALFAAIAAVLAATIAVVALVFVLARGNGGNDNEPDVPTLGGGPAPTDLQVKDRGSSVQITWTDSGEGKNSTIITGGHPGEVLKPMGEVGPGETSFELRGLNDQLDYCFAVVAVYGTNSFATSAQSCTTRPGPASTG